MCRSETAPGAAIPGALMNCGLDGTNQAVGKPPCTIPYGIGDV
jgi:hypothetical protein